MKQVEDRPVKPGYEKDAAYRRDEIADVIEKYSRVRWYQWLKRRHLMRAYRFQIVRLGYCYPSAPCALLEYASTVSTRAMTK